MHQPDQTLAVAAAKPEKPLRRYWGTPRAILIITQKIDPHADSMVLQLERRGIKPVRYHPESVGPQEQLAIEFQPRGGWQWSLQSPAGLVSNREIGSVWYRRTLFARNRMLPPGDAEFAEAETRETVLGMWRMTDAFWVSHPDALRVAESKPYQLKLAQEIGFRIPRTLLTNDPQRFTDFYEQCRGRVIYKPLTQGNIGLTEHKGVYTNRVASEHLGQLDAIRLAPCLFQEHLAKAVDLRVTVIGDRLFPVEIHSQAQEASRTDWRRGNPHALRHSLHTLPAAVEQNCLQLLRRLRLQFGAIDLVLTDENEYVFLEINPSGQFAWIEGLTKLPLMATLADLLVSKCASGS